MKISQMSEGDRPREKMMQRGSGALGNAELVAVLLRTGSRSCSALEVAQQLLSRCGGSLIRLSRMTVTELSRTDGVGTYKALAIASALELGRRFVAEGSALDKNPVTASSDVFRLMLPRLKGLEREQLWVVLLNKAKYVISTQQLSNGSTDSTTIDPRDVVLYALQSKAAAIVLVHNHPSGNPQPSKADIAQTADIKKAASTMDICLLDHVIICDDCFYSFADDSVTYQ